MGNQNTKNITPSTNGRITLPNKYPKLIQSLFKGSKSSALITDNAKNTKVNDENV